MALDCLLVLLWVELAYFFLVQLPSHKSLIKSSPKSKKNTIPLSSPTDFDKVMQEVEKYRKLKPDIRNQAKAKVKEIMK